MNQFWINHGVRICAVISIIVLYSFAALPRLEIQELNLLTTQFSFEEEAIENSTSLRNRREVNPSYEHISAWISSVGSSVTLADLSNKGVYSDIVLVDPRTDNVYWMEGTKRVSSMFKIKKLPFDRGIMAPMGTLVNDFNMDGYVDVLVYYWGRSPVIFYSNDSSFIEKELSSTLESWYSNAGTVADFNGDGYMDILIGNYFPDNAKVLDKFDSTIQTMQHSMSRADNGGLNRLFLYDKNSPTNFREDERWLENLGIKADWTLAVAAADLNGDLLPEVYISNDFGPDKLLLNVSKSNKLKFELLKGERGISTMASCVLGEDSFKGMGAEFGDINNDGLLDIYVSNIAAEYALEESHFLFLNTGEELKDHKAPFINKSEELGLSRSSWGWDCKLADFNNDGIQETIQATGFVKGDINRWAELHEIAMGNDELLSTTSMWHKIEVGDDLCGNAHNPLFARGIDGRYYDIASGLGIDKSQVSRGVAVGDVDHDGDLDFIVSNQWDKSRLYINKINKSRGDFLGLDIRRKIEVREKDSLYIRNGAPLVGCQAKILSINGDKTSKTYIDFVDGGNGHSGVSSPEIFFGLGKQVDDTVVEVELKWRDLDGKLNNKVIECVLGWHQIIL